MAYWLPAQLAPWLAALKAGGVVAAPAEGLYGYCADPFNPAALRALMEIKQRDPSKGLIVLISAVEQLGRLCPPLTEAQQIAIATHWQPGQPPTTLILPALATLTPLLTGGHATIAVRLPQNPYMQEYLAAAQTPLVSTSANLSGQPAATTAAQLAPEVPALTLPQPLSGTPSRIFNPQTGHWLR